MTRTLIINDVTSHECQSKNERCHESWRQLGKNHATSHDVRWEWTMMWIPDAAQERNDPTNHDTDRDEDDTTNQNVTQGINDDRTTNESILQQNSESISITITRRWSHLLARKLKFTRMNRGRETIATRLRFGKCGLNFYLQIIGNTRLEIARNVTYLKHWTFYLAMPQQFGTGHRIN